MDIQLCQTKRGQDLLIVDGYTYYVKRKLKKGEILWNCSSKCSAKVYTLMDKISISRFVSEHCHEKDKKILQKKKLIQSVKQKAVEDVFERPSEIIHTAIAENSTSIKNLTTKDVLNLKKMIYRKKRKKMLNLLKNREVKVEILTRKELKTRKGEADVIFGLESSSKACTSSSTSPTSSGSYDMASQASTLTSRSSKNGTAFSNHRPPKPPIPPRAPSLLPENKTIRNSDGTFKFLAVNGDTSSSDKVTVPLTKLQAPRRQGKSADYSNLEDQKVFQNLQEVTHSTEDISDKNDNNQEDNWRNTSSGQINHTENKFSNEEKAVSAIMSLQGGIYDNFQNSVKEPNIQTSINLETSASNQKEKLVKSVLSRNKHSPLTKSSARPPPIYSKRQTGNFSKNLHPWKTLEDSYMALTSSNRELLIKLMNQALKKRKNLTSKLNKFEFHWADFEIDANQSSSVFALGENIAYHATIQKCPEYELTLVVSIEQQNRLHENSELQYPVFGKFTDCIPSEFLGNAGDCELAMPATILILDRSNVLTVECFSDNLPEFVTEENEKEICFIILQLIQSLKTLQVQGIESIDMNCQNLLLVKTKRDNYHTLVFLYDICYEENDYSVESCKVSLCQYTVMLLFQLLKIQAVDDTVTGIKFSSNMSRKVFETASFLLSEEKAVSLSQTKTLFECYLWGVTKVLESLQNLDDCDNILHRWLDIERSTCIKTIVNDESNDINVQNEYYSQFLIRTNVRNIREVVSYL